MPVWSASVVTRRWSRAAGRGSPGADLVKGRAGARSEAGTRAAAGGMRGEAVPEIRRAVWAKLLGNLMTGPLCILSRSCMEDTLASPAVRDTAVP